MPRLELMFGGEHFDPEAATDRFRIAGTDYPATVLAPGLAQRMFRQAPGTTPHLTTAVLAVPGADLVATHPERMLTAAAHDPGNRILLAPKEIDTMPYLMSWHPRLDDDPAQRWLRDVVRLVAS